MRARWRWYSLLVASAALGGPLEAQQRPQLNEVALRDTLVGIVLGMYAAWEPQSQSESAALARARAPLVTDSTFAMIIDATYRATYESWADRLLVSIPTAYRDYREQHHTVTVARLLPLSNDAAALTLTYCVDFVKTDGGRGIVNSGATLVFVRTPAGWKIAQYHGSHGTEVITEAKCRAN